MARLSFSLSLFENGINNNTSGVGNTILGGLQRTYLLACLLFNSYLLSLCPIHVTFRNTIINNYYHSYLPFPKIDLLVRICTNFITGAKGVGKNKARCGSTLNVCIVITYYVYESVFSKTCRARHVATMTNKKLRSKIILL